MALAFTLGATARTSVAQPQPHLLTRNQVADDIAQLLEVLERSHPDPHGSVGKREFHRRAQNLLASPPEAGWTREDLENRIDVLLASLHDGHTRVARRTQSLQVAPRALPLRLRVIAADDSTPDRTLYVQAASDPSLVGARLIAIDAIPFDTLWARQRALESAENEFGHLAGLASRIETGVGLVSLIPSLRDRAAVSVALRLPDGATHRVLLPLGEPWPSPSPDSAAFPVARGGVPAYRFADADRRVAILRLDNTWAHREIFDPLVKFGQAIPPFDLRAARLLFERVHGRPAPQDTTRTVDGLPAATEVFGSLVRDMRRFETDTLVVDLRRNGGGHSMMVNMLLYYLFGRESWRTFFGAQYTIGRHERGTDSTGTASRFPGREGDYDFSGMARSASRPASEAGAEDFWRRVTRTFADELASSQHEAHYRPPHVIVLVGPRTFSGGFWLAAALKRHGAALVGVPSGQAGNSFGDVRFTSLKESGITVGVSTRIFVLFPGHLGPYPVLPVDAPLTYELWRRTGFDPDAELRLVQPRPPTR